MTDAPRRRGDGGPEPGGPGEVRDLRTGRSLGATADLWEEFCANAARVRAWGPCYVVAALQDVPVAVRERLEAMSVPLVHDDRASGGYAILLGGQPAEWGTA